MEVTKENFEDAMDSIERVLNDPTLEFMSFDEEMTGLGFAGVGFDELNKYEDTSDERYIKMRRIAQAFGIIQLGLTAWTRSTINSNEYVAHSWNIYVFPKGEEGNDIVLSPSAVEFLSENGMDWQKWFTQGVPYLCRESANSEPIKSHSVQLFRADDQQFANQELERIRNFLTTEDSSHTIHETLPTRTSAVARWIHEAVRDNFGTIARTERRPGYKIGVIRLNSHQAQEARRIESQKSATRIGARRVFLTIVAAAQRGIPLVGHNCYFDLLFLFAHFDSLPDTYQEFKTLVHTSFPRVFDTKVLASHHQNLNTNLIPSGIKTTLNSLFEHLESSETKQYSISFAPICQKYASANYPITSSLTKKNTTDFDDESEGEVSDNNIGQVQQFHEAGWDSFVTGIVFLRLGTPPTNLENHLYNLRSNLTVDLANHSSKEDIHWQAQGTVYSLKGPISKEKIARIFPNTINIYRIAYNGTDSWLLDLEPLTPELLVSLNLPPDTHLLPWCIPEDTSMQLSSALDHRDVSITEPRKRILTWIKSKLSPLMGISTDQGNSKRPRKRHRSNTNNAESPVHPALNSTPSTASESTPPP